MPNFFSQFLFFLSVVLFLSACSLEVPSSRNRLEESSSMRDYGPALRILSSEYLSIKASSTGPDISDELPHLRIALENVDNMEYIEERYDEMNVHMIYSYQGLDGTTYEIDSTFVIDLHEIDDSLRTITELEKDHGHRILIPEFSYAVLSTENERNLATKFSFDPQRMLMNAPVVGTPYSIKRIWIEGKIRGQERLEGLLLLSDADPQLPSWCRVPEGLSFVYNDRDQRYQIIRFGERSCSYYTFFPGRSSKDSM